MPQARLDACLVSPSLYVGLLLDSLSFESFNEVHEAFLPCALVKIVTIYDLTDESLLHFTWRNVLKNAITPNLQLLPNTVIMSTLL